MPGRAKDQKILRGPRTSRQANWKKSSSTQSQYIKGGESWLVFQMSNFKEKYKAYKVTENHSPIKEQNNKPEANIKEMQTHELPDK